MSMVERVARAMERNSGIRAAPNWWLKQARAAIEAMRSQTLVYRDNGHVVHELRGAPDDIWKTLLDAALGEGE